MKIEIVYTLYISHKSKFENYCKYGLFPLRYLGFNIGKVRPLLGLKVSNIM